MLKSLFTFSLQFQSFLFADSQAMWQDEDAKIAWKITMKLP
jgi:hypothetical protein